MNFEETQAVPTTAPTWIALILQALLHDILANWCWSPRAPSTELWAHGILSEEQDVSGSREDVSFQTFHISPLKSSIGSQSCHYLRTFQAAPPPPPLGGTECPAPGCGTSTSGWLHCSHKPDGMTHNSLSFQGTGCFPRGHPPSLLGVWVLLFSEKWSSVTLAMAAPNPARWTGLK